MKRGNIRPSTRTSGSISWTACCRTTLRCGREALWRRAAECRACRGFGRKIRETSALTRLDRGRRVAARRRKVRFGGCDLGEGGHDSEAKSITAPSRPWAGSPGVTWTSRPRESRLAVVRDKRSGRRNLWFAVQFSATLQGCERCDEDHKASGRAGSRLSPYRR